MDLSRFLEKQRVTDAPDSLLDADHDDDDDVDTSLAHITSHTSRRTTAPSRKGKVEQVEWDEQLEFISRAKATAEATWGELTKCYISKITIQVYYITATRY